MADSHLTATFTDNLSFSSLSSDNTWSDVLNRSLGAARPPRTRPSQGTTHQATALASSTPPGNRMPRLHADESVESLMRSPSPTRHDRLLSGGERFYDDDEDIPLSQLETDHRRRSLVASTSAGSGTPLPHNDVGSRTATAATNTGHRRAPRSPGAGEGGTDESGGTSTSLTSTRQSSTHGFGLGVGPPTFLHDTRQARPPPHASQPAERSGDKAAAAQDSSTLSSLPPLPTALDARERQAVSQLVALAAGASALPEPALSAGGGGHNTTVSSSVLNQDQSSGGGKKKTVVGSTSSRKSGGKEGFDWESVEGYLLAAYTALRTDNEEVMSSVKAPKHRMGWYTVIYSVCNSDPSMSWRLYVRLAATVARALEVLVLFPMLQRVDQRLVAIRTDSADSPSGDDVGPGGGSASPADGAAGGRHAHHTPAHSSGSAGVNGGGSLLATMGSGRGHTLSSSRRGSTPDTPVETAHSRPPGSAFHFMRRFFFGNEDNAAHHKHAADGTGPASSATDTPISTPAPSPFITSSSLLDAPTSAGDKPAHGHVRRGTSSGSKKDHKSKSTSGKDAPNAATDLSVAGASLGPCEAFNKEYADFAVFQRIVLSCFSYLDQYYTQRFHMDKITTLCVKLFYVVVFEPMRHLLLSEVLTRAYRLRATTSTELGGLPSSPAAAATDELGPATLARQAADAARGGSGIGAGNDTANRARVVSDDLAHNAAVVTETIATVSELIMSVQAKPSYLVTAEPSASAHVTGSGTGARQSPSPGGADRGFLSVVTSMPPPRRLSRQSSAASSIVSTPRMGPVGHGHASDGGSAMLSPIGAAAAASGGGESYSGGAGGGYPASLAAGAAAPVRKRRRFLSFWSRKDDKAEKVSSQASSRTASQAPLRHETDAATPTAGVEGRPFTDKSPLPPSVSNTSITSSTHNTGAGADEESHICASGGGCVEVDLRDVIALRQRLDDPQLVHALGNQAYHSVPQSGMPASTYAGSAPPRGQAGAVGAGVGGPAAGSADGNDTPLYSSASGAPGVPSSAAAARPSDVTPCGSIVMGVNVSLEAFTRHAFAEVYIEQLRDYYHRARNRQLSTAEGRRSYIAWVRRVWDMEHSFISKSHLIQLHHAVRRALVDVLITSVHREVMLDPSNGFGPLLDTWAGLRSDDGLVAAVLDAPVGAVMTRESVHARHTTTASFSLSTASKVVAPTEGTAFSPPLSAGHQPFSLSAVPASRSARGRAYVPANEGPGRESLARTARAGRGQITEAAPTQVETALAVGQFFWVFTRAEHDETCLLLLASVLASRVIASAAATMRTYMEVLARSPPPPAARAELAGERRTGGTSMTSVVSPPTSATGRTPLPQSSPQLPLTAAMSTAALSADTNARTEAAADTAVEELLINYQRCRELIEVEMRGHTVMMSALHDAMREVLNPHRWTRQGALAASEMRVRALSNLSNHAGTAGGAWQLPSVLLSKDAGARATAPLTALARDYPFSVSLSVPEMLAAYCDHILQRQFCGPGVNASVSPEVEAHFSAVASLASLLDDKDIFLEHIRLRLARRLLDLVRPANLRAEYVLVRAFQSVFTLEDVHSLEAMLRDVFSGMNASSQFESSAENAALLASATTEAPVTRLGVRVLTCAGWPVRPQELPVQLPPSLTRGVQAFEDYYTRRHPSRRLRWVHALATVTLTAELPHGTKEIVANVYQAALLLAVSEASQSANPRALGEGEAATRRPHSSRVSPPPELEPSQSTSSGMVVMAASVTSENGADTGLESSFVSVLSASRVEMTSPANGPLDDDDDDENAEDLVTAETNFSLRPSISGSTARRVQSLPRPDSTSAPVTSGGGGRRRAAVPGSISGHELARRVGLRFAQLRSHLATVTLNGPTALVRRLPRHRDGARSRSPDGPALAPDQTDVDDAVVSRTHSTRSGSPVDEPGAHDADRAHTPAVSFPSMTPTRSTTIWSHFASSASAIALEEDDHFTLNREFRHPQRRLQLPARRGGPPIQTSATAGHDGPASEAGGAKASQWRSATAVHVEQSLKSSRAVRMDAVLIRIMKSRRLLPFAELQELATEQLASQFLPTSRELKERLAALLERGYLQRSPDAETILQYVA